MTKTAINPAWNWDFGYTQAWKVAETDSILFLAGQFAWSEDGQLVGEDDFETQCRKTLENTRTVLEAAGGSLADLVQIKLYLTDRNNFGAWMRIRDEYIDTDSPPASTGIVVKSLALPEMLIEIDGVAVL